MTTAISEMQDFDGAAFVAACAGIVGAAHVWTAASDVAGYGTDWTGKYAQAPVAVVRPVSVEEISALVKLCAAHGIAVIPQGGRTGLCGGGVPIVGQPSLIITLERMNKLRELDAAARTVTVEAGMVLEVLQGKVAAHGLKFPLMFGAKGSCMIGGNLATNAGGSNVVRYGNTRELCLGIEAVMPDGTIVNALSGLRKDNTGYDLKDLLIGAEGTLGIITAAVFKLFPEPVVRATAFLSLSSLDIASEVLNRLQDATGSAVEAFEYMPRPAVDVICRVFPEIRQPLETPAEVGLLIEVASSRADDAAMADDGTVRLEGEVLELLGTLMEEELVLDAMIAQSDQQRSDLWRMREAILESITEAGPAYHMDIALPLAQIAPFVATMDAACAEAGFQPLTVGHLGDGNLHYALAAAEGRDWDALPLEAIKQKAFDVLSELRGSFSAEHGVGQSKLDLMVRLKDPGQLAVMRLLKVAIDPKNIMNPGKLVPLA